MSRVAAAGIQPVAVGLVVILYAVIAHWFSTVNNLSALWLPLAVAPLWLALALNARWRFGAVLIVIAGIALVFNHSLRAFFSSHLAWIYFLQDSALNIALACLFGLTLRPGRVPLCSQLQTLLQPESSAQTLRYTRSVTQAWTGFFVLIIAISTLLFCFAERATWSLFANLLYWPLLLAMFALEYCARLILLPLDQRPGFGATISAFNRFTAQRGERVAMSASLLPETLPLLTHADMHAPIAYRGEQCIDVKTFLADVARLVALLPAGTHMMNLCADRYHFLVGLAASMSAGKICLLPSNQTPESVRQMRAFAPDVFCLIDMEAAIDLPLLRYPEEATPAGEPALAIPHFPAAQTVAYVFTSGSTGTPVAHAKTWGALVRSIHTGAERLKLNDGRAYTVVGTVPPQHMFGFESTVLLPLQTGGALWAGKPFYPADISATLAALPQPCVLVSTPFHLRTWVDAELECPPLHCVLSATAPLNESLAAAVENYCAAPLLEIYGCTESGQIATRRPTECSEWRLLDSVRLQQVDATTFVEGDFIDGRKELGDIIELTAADRFVLRGRSADLINIAGKRTSLAFLNQQLLAIPGVLDGVFLQPNSDDADGIGRLGAFAVSTELSAAAIVHALRERIDSVFLPRPLYLVERLPRNAAGKLPQRELLALWQQTQQQNRWKQH